MKFLNFFKTGLGIFIIIVVIAAIILISMNWTTIKTWWNTPSTPDIDNTTPSDGSNELPTRIANGSNVPVYNSNGTYRGDYNVSDNNQRKTVCNPGEVLSFNTVTQRFECHPYSS